MAAEESGWSLIYDRLGNVQEVPFIDASIIGRTLRRLEQTETCVCQLRHGLYQSVVCRGGPDKFIVECLRVIIPGLHGSLGSMPGGISLLGRKNDTYNRVLRVRWKSKPVVFVDVRAHSVLSLAEVVTVFETYFTSMVIHQDFTTIPKPMNGYLT
jgi:hypothetical protein